MSEPQIEEREELPYLAMTREVTDGVPAAVDEAFPSLYRWIGEQGVEPAGPPLIRVLEVDRKGDPLVLEAGAPVAAGTEGDPGTVDARTLPAGRYVVAEHVGPYRHETERDMGDARKDLIEWMKSEKIPHGRESERGMTLACAYDQMHVGPTDESDYSKW